MNEVFGYDQKELGKAIVGLVKSYEHYVRSSFNVKEAKLMGDAIMVPLMMMADHLTPENREKLSKWLHKKLAEIEEEKERLRKS